MHRKRVAKVRTDKSPRQSGRLSHRAYAACRRFVRPSMSEAELSIAASINSISSHKELSVMGGLPLSTASSAVELPGQQQSQDLLTKATEPASKPKKKICCACPDTKRLRDECMVEHGEAACMKWIEAHKQCLRAEGFNV
ncbi:Cytochrome c oxidase copper chaperone 1-like protein [Drosera capensis]